MESEQIIFLMKMVTCEKHAESILDGKLHAKRLRYFRDQGMDPYEGAMWFQPDRVELKIGERAIPGEDLDGPLVMWPDRVGYMNIFCMFAFFTGDGLPATCEQVTGFIEKQLGSLKDCAEELGPYTVVVTNATKFLKRVDRAVKAQRVHRPDCRHIRGRVRYFDPSSHNTDLMNPLRIPLDKRDQFAHQKEYRIVVDTGKIGCDHLDLEIGCIRDIAILMKTTEVASKVTFHFPECQVGGEEG